jgi:hypothetical protein
MNKLKKSFFLTSLAALVLCSAFAVRAQVQAASGNDEYFIISSIDKAHNALILLRPTQITATIAVTPKTQFFDEKGKAQKFTDFRTGDTIFVTYSSQPDHTLTASSVRKGMMTMAEMRKRYLPGLPITKSPPGLGRN